MSIDANMWFKMKTTEKRAKQIVDDLINDRDPWLCDTLRNMWTTTYGLQFNHGLCGVKGEIEPDRWAVRIDCYHGKGYTNFTETARYILDRYPDVELSGGEDNDCFDHWKGYGGEYYGGAGFYFDVKPEDWDAFLAGDYANTTQGRKEIERRKKEGEPEPEPERVAQPKTDANNDDDLPF